MASGAAMRARRCGGILRSIATSSRWRRSRRWRMPGRSIARPSSRRARIWGSTPASPIRSTARVPRKELPLAAREIQVPDIGDFKNVEVIDVLVKAGDRVEAETPLLTLETEKATMDVPAPFAGVIEKLLVSKGSKVSAGTAIALLQGEAEAAPAPAAAAAKPADAPAPTAAATAPAATAAA